MRAPLLPLVACALALLSVAPAGAKDHRNSDPAERRYNPYTGRLPACADPAVIGEVTSEFAQREGDYWLSGLTIRSVDRINEGRYRPWGKDFIPRRFCEARVTLSNLRQARVSYSVREGLGLFGWTWEVNWCVQGLDRHKTYAPECHMARP